MEKIRLNKFVAHSGLCSRREAGILIKQGKVKVNGLVEKNPAQSVSEEDIVEYKEQRLKIEKRKVYLLLNKPKGINTSQNKDSQEKTIFDLLEDEYKDEVSPGDSLDERSLGLLILSNDEDLIKKLSDPKREIKKVYHVVLKEELKENDLNSIQEGLDIEGEHVEIDSISYFENTKNEIGVELKSGRPNIIQKIFKLFDHEVISQDRVLYGSLTKKNISRGRYRHLTEREVIFLKHF